MKKIHIAIILILFFGMRCSNGKKSKNESATKDDIVSSTNKWISIFDGQTTDGWRGFNETSIPAGWVVEEGTLKSLGKGGDIGGDIVYGKRAFTDFELYLEWKVSTAGNSGIFYHIQEGEKYSAPYENAPEYQLIDDLGYPDPLEGWQKLASDYAMYPAPESKPVRPAGEWNSSRIVFTKEKAEYYLNGVLVVSFVPWSDNWQQKRQEGKWKDYPDYGKSKTGLIGLQDHGSFIWFRNIKIREL